MRLLPAAVLLSLLMSGCSRGPEGNAATGATPPAPAVPPATAPMTAPLGGPIPQGTGSAQAIVEASRRFGQLRSFKAELRLQGARTMEAGMVFVAPDRYRLETEAGVQTIINGTFFLQRAGEVRQVPVPPELLAQWRSPLPADAAAADMEVEALGSDTVAGRETQRYRVRHASAAPDGLVYWIDADGLPVRIERRGQTNGQPYVATVTYSHINDPALRVELP